MRIVVALLLLLTPACTCEPEPDWHGDVRFSAEERTAIERGEAWLATSAGRQPSTFAWDYVATERVEPRTVRRENTGHTGLCHDGTRAVSLDPDDPNAMPGTLDGLAAHEMAHCELGLVDDPKSDGIMHRVTPMLWTAREQAQLHR